MDTFTTVLYWGVLILTLVSLWKIYEKAGEPGWAAIIPIYNFVILLKIVEKPVWWVILFIIPVVNIVIIILVYFRLGKMFGKSDGFSIGLILLSFIFLPILAFGDDVYQGHTNSEQGEDLLDQI